MLLLNRNWNETKHFQMSPAPPPRSCRALHDPGRPRPPPWPPRHRPQAGLQGRGFRFSFTMAPFPKSPLRKKMACALLNRLIYSKTVAGKEDVQKDLKVSWEVISRSSVLRPILPPPLTLYSEGSGNCSFWISRAGCKAGGHPAVTSDPEAGALRNPVYGGGVTRAGHDPDGWNKKGSTEK